MADVNRYVGARYVPVFADPVEWDNTRTYEPLTIVTRNGASYTSKQAVPVGTDITNDDYWVATGNYNAQVEAYRQEVQAFDTRITDNATAIEAEESARIAEDNRIYTNSIMPLQTDVAAAQTDATQALADASAAQTDATQALADAAAAQSTADEALAAAQVAAKKTHIAFIGDSFSDGSGEVANILANNLGFSLINKATAGAGFVAGAYKFSAQLQDIINDTNFSNVDTVFVYGGVNDWNDAGATQVQMTNAIAEFFELYYAIPAANRPRIIVAFGNCGKTTLAQYDGFLKWQKLVVRGMHNTGYPGVVDNVCNWLCGYAAGNVFNSDNLHPNSVGSNIIASYLEACYNGTYNGVFQYADGTSSYGIDLEVMFNNGIISASVKGLGISLPTTSGYNNIATVGDRQLTFGGDNSSNNNQNFITSVPLGIYADSSGNTAQRQLVFNARNGNLYVQNIGTVSLLPSGTVNLDTVLCGYPVS